MGVGEVKIDLEKVFYSGGLPAINEPSLLDT